VLNRLRLISISNNLGDTKSLITHPATTTHERFNAAERARIGITDDLLRLSVGLEDPADLIADLDQALSGAAAAPDERASASIESCLLAADAAQ
jgi:O-succinylhomoserine sulfhydrylase